MQIIPNLRKTAMANQLQFKRPQQIVEEWFESRNIGPLQSDIQIFPEYGEYHTGWQAAVIVWDRVWIVGGEYYTRANITRFKLFIDDIQPIRGFRPNGAIIFKAIDNEYTRRNPFS